MKGFKDFIKTEAIKQKERDEEAAKFIAKFRKRFTSHNPTITDNSVSVSVAFNNVSMREAEHILNYVGMYDADMLREIPKLKIYNPSHDIKLTIDVYKSPYNLRASLYTEGKFK